MKRSHIERRAMLLAKQAMDARIDYRDWAHLCKIAYAAAIRQQVENDLADEQEERVTRTWRVYQGGRDD